MVFFEDILDHCLVCHSSSDGKTVRIQHFTSSNDYDVLILSNPEYYVSQLEDPAAACDSSEIKLSTRGSNSLSDLLPYAYAVIEHSDNRLATDPEFILDYQNILIGRRPGWRLYAAEVCPNTVYLYYVNNASDAICQIGIEKCPHALYLEVPVVTVSDDTTNDHSLLDRILNRNPQSTVLLTGVTATIAIQYSEADGMAVYAGDLRLGLPEPDDLEHEQRMLYVANNPDDDGRIITRIYPRSAFRRDTLPSLLQCDSDTNIFTL